MSVEATSYQRLREHLSYLGLTTAAENLSSELDRALKDRLSRPQAGRRALDPALGRGAPQCHPARAARGG